MARKIKSMKYWRSLENILSEVKKLMKEHDIDRLPSQGKLQELGYGSLNAAITKYHGGFSNFRKSLGEKESQKPNVYWTLENTISESKKVMEENNLDRLPSRDKINELGYGSLNAAITKYHGGFSKFRELLGEEPSKKHYGYWTLEKTISESNKIMKEHNLDTLPSKNKLKELGYSGLGATIAQYYGGMANFKELLSQELSTKPEGYLKNINDTLFTANKIMDRNKKGIQNIKEANKQSYSLKEIMDLAGVYIPLGDDDTAGESILA